MRHGLLVGVHFHIGYQPLGLRHRDSCHESLLRAGERVRRRARLLRIYSFFAKCCGGDVDDFCARQASQSRASLASTNVPVQLDRHCYQAGRTNPSSRKSTPLVQTQRADDQRACRDAPVAARSRATCVARALGGMTKSNDFAIVDEKPKWGKLGPVRQGEERTGAND